MHLVICYADDMIIFGNGSVPSVTKLASLLDEFNKIKSKILNWKNKFLSAGGKLALIRAILKSLPIHTIAAIPIPKSVVRRIEKIITSFLWDVGAGKRYHWISWKAIYKPICDEGLGIGKLHQIVSAFRAKMAWKYLVDNSLWVRVMRSRYKDVEQNDSHCWNGFRDMIEGVRKESF
uniref:Reverse transcriptase n=1 Tax=Kalanchoe fedtschenkoi TaxID=63787 RepID=A0A7N0TNA1_KALFE